MGICAVQVRDWRGNAIVVDEFTEDQLDLSARQDTALFTLWEYLDTTVLEKMQQSSAMEDGGVPALLRRFPYPSTR
jgi:hypothetical protein